MDPELKAAVEGAYRVFARYGLGGRIGIDQDIDGVGPLEERLLVLTPLREIPAELLAIFVTRFKIIAEAGDADDIASFLALVQAAGGDVASLTSVVEAGQPRRQPKGAFRMTRFHLAALVLAVGFAAPASAASDDAWEQFRADVEDACLKAAEPMFETATATVDPFGSESYGLALVSGKAKGAESRDLPDLRLRQEDQDGGDRRRAAGRVAAPGYRSFAFFCAPLSKPGGPLRRQGIADPEHGE